MSGHHDDHGFAHPVPLRLLVGVFVALIALTILTVVTAGRPELRPFGTWIAMAIATAKGLLVLAVFMHLWWDKKFNLIVFGSAFLFVALFIGFTLTDTQHYQNVIDVFPPDKYVPRR